MSKRSLIGLLCAALALCVAGAPSFGADPAAKPGSDRDDPFVGDYSIGLVGSYVRITRDGDTYRMSGTTGQHSAFKKVSENVLKADNLGTLTLGHLAFADAPDKPLVVLKASFCYEHLLLIKLSAADKDGQPSTVPAGPAQSVPVK